MSRNSKNAKQHAQARDRNRTKGYVGPKATTPVHGKKKRSKYNTYDRTGFSLDGNRGARAEAAAS